MDEIIGEERINRFACELSRLLAHQESEGSTLCSAIQSKDIQAQLSLNVINSAAELETGWNVLRLANVPSAQRHGRVASEFIGIAVLSVIPRDILKALGQKAPVAKHIKAFPNQSVSNLCMPRLVESGGTTRIKKPILSATEAFRSFLVVAEYVIRIPVELVRNMLQYREEVQHPASHGTWQVTGYHFEAFSGGAAGTVFDPKRAGSYVSAADDLIGLADTFAGILDATAVFLLKPGR